MPSSSFARTLNSTLPRSLASLVVLSLAVQAGLPAPSAITVVNPLSTIPITVDGQFTGGVNPGPPPALPSGSEWSDVTPLAFISPPTSAGPLLSVPRSDPNVNSLLYAAVAPGNTAVAAELYLMYDYLPRTINTFLPGEFVASFNFPLTIGGTLFPNAVVRVEGRIPLPPVPFGFVVNAGVDLTLVDFFVDLDGIKDASDPLASTVGIDGAIGFGPSTLSVSPHLLIELEVPLNIPAGFGGVLPPTGGKGVYSPDPAFWGGNIANDLVDPASSGANMVILNNGTTILTAAVPEVTVAGWAGLALLGLGGCQAWRRRSVRRPNR